MKEIKSIFVKVINSIQWKHVINTLNEKRPGMDIPSANYDAFVYYHQPAIAVMNGSNWYGDCDNLIFNESLISFDSFCELYGQPKIERTEIDDLTFRVEEDDVCITDGLDEVAFGKEHIDNVIDYLLSVKS